MLNKKTFEKLTKRLKSVNPNMSFPDGFEDLLWEEGLEALPINHKVNVILVHEGQVPEYAYFVVSGLVTVHGYLDGIPFTESLYRENTIVGLREFMERKKSEHTVVAARHALVWRISATTMEKIYEKWPEMKAFAMQTAMKYLEMKKDRRNAFFTMPAEDRVKEFYSCFKGLLPVRSSPLTDTEIASYLNLNLYTFRKNRAKIYNNGFE